MIILPWWEFNSLENYCDRKNFLVKKFILVNGHLFQWQEFYFCNRNIFLVKENLFLWQECYSCGEKCILEQEFYSWSMFKNHLCRSSNRSLCEVLIFCVNLVAKIDRDYPTLVRACVLFMSIRFEPMNITLLYLFFIPSRSYKYNYSSTSLLD